MYFYIFDQLALKPRFGKALDKISLRITDLGIEGEKSKATVTKEVSGLVEEALARKKENIIIVGNDKSFTQALGVVAKTKAKVVLGYIPLESSLLQKALHLPLQSEACYAISQRKVAEFDLGKVNHSYFLTSMAFSADKNFFESGSVAKVKNLFKKRDSQDPLFYFQYQDGFKLQVLTPFFLVSNMLSSVEKDIFKNQEISLSLQSHRDAKLDVIILSETPDIKEHKGLTFFQTTHLAIKSQHKQTVILDGLNTVQDKDFIISVLPTRLKAIVGSHEGFGNK
ncbi:hypothetical protein KKC60_05720 [Patescibacteria group bacterium]|nr:hypothetical protein [Patescibacteria group bacterium]